MMTRRSDDPSARCVRHLQTTGVLRDDIQTFFVPGRIELLGKHTDYCGGRSVTCAIDRGFSVAYAPSDRPTLTLHALDLRRSASFDLSPDLQPASGWANYPMSVVRRLARNFGEVRGATIAFSSTLPQAAGMSSSSGLIIATFLALDAINGLARRAPGDIASPTDLAEYLGTLENGQSYRSLAGDRGVGTFGGSEDHTAITLGRAGHVSVYQYGPTRLDRHVPLPEGLSFVVASSGVIAEKTGAARDRYNRAALLVRRLVELWNAHRPDRFSTLADIVRSHRTAADALRSLTRDHVPDPVEALALLRRLDHFVVESESIIPDAMDAFANADLETFGRLVDESQKLAQTGLQNQVPETIFLASAARQLGAHAASAFGAGFGGSVWALVSNHAADAFVDRWQAAYHAAFEPRAELSSFFITRSVDGTSAHIDPLRPS